MMAPLASSDTSTVVWSGREARLATGLMLIITSMIFLVTKTIDVFHGGPSAPLFSDMTSTDFVRLVCGSLFGIVLGYVALALPVRWVDYVAPFLLTATPLFSTYLHYSRSDLSVPTLVSLVVPAGSAAYALRTKWFVAVIVTIIAGQSAAVVLLPGRAGELSNWIAVFCMVVALGFVVIHMRSRQTDTRMRLRSAAMTDELTGLGNRAAFDEALHQVLQDDDELAIVIADVDSFKSINDAHGHPFGDQVLRQVGGILRESTGSLGHWCRIGGDEFAVVLHRASEAQALALAQKVVEAVRGSKFDEVDRPVTVSVGVSVLDTAHLAAGSALRSVDAALYDAKSRGRDQASTADDTGATAAVMDVLGRA